MIGPTTGMSLQRTYLYVPPEEKSEVLALGALWDAASKCWYIDADGASEHFSRWLTDTQADDEFTITSDRAYVAASRVPCQHCHAPIEVICIHCESGTTPGDQLACFTVSNIWAVDDALSGQLTPWPLFRRVDPDGGDSYFANHCPCCGTSQDDMLLHSEPDQPFFNIPRAPLDSVSLTRISGPIQLSGDEHFEVD